MLCFHAATVAFKIFRRHKTERSLVKLASSTCCFQLSVYCLSTVGCCFLYNHRGAPESDILTLHRCWQTSPAGISFSDVCSGVDASECVMTDGMSMETIGESPPLCLMFVYLKSHHPPHQRRRRTAAVWCCSSRTWSSCDGRTSPPRSAAPSRTPASDRRSTRRCHRCWRGTLFWGSPVEGESFDQRFRRVGSGDKRRGEASSRI